MLVLLDYIKALNLTQKKAYVFVGVLFLMLLMENVIGVNIPLFYVSEENTIPFIMLLLSVLGFGIKNSIDNAAAQKEAEDNAIAAISIATNIPKEQIEKLISEVKAYAEAIDKTKGP